MTIEEINIDLFEFYENNPHYILVQCISSDFMMSEGIAVEFNKIFNVRNLVKGICIPYWTNQGYCISLLDLAPVFNLVTKEKYFLKPTYKTLIDALNNMKEIIIENNIRYIAMPRIGCGSDKLKWKKVRFILEDLFSDVDIDIKMCYK